MVADSLAEFDMVLEYKPGRTNQVADALSRKARVVRAKRVLRLNVVPSASWLAAA